MSLASILQCLYYGLKVNGVFVKLAFVDQDLKVVFLKNQKNFLEIFIMLFLRFREKKYIFDIKEDATHVHKYVVHKSLEC